MPTERIAFTACSKFNFDAEQQVWDDIREQQPHHLMLLGDQIYMDFWGEHARRGDTSGFKPYLSGEPARVSDAEFEAQMRLRYNQQLEVPSFRALVHDIGKRGGAVGLIWDDHDFGFNNAMGRHGGPLDSDPDWLEKVMSPAKRAISRRLFEEFRLGVDALRHNDRAACECLPGNWTPPSGAPGFVGVQRCYKLGPVDVLMLDTRSFRQTPTPAGHSAPASELLGKAQWNWLEDQVRRSRARLVVIASGSTLSSAGFFADQSWRQSDEEHLPYIEYPKLIRLAREMQGQNRHMLFVGGDRHAVTFIEEYDFLPEVVCAGAAAPNGFFRSARHFCLVDTDKEGASHVRLFTRGVVEHERLFFGAASTQSLNPAKPPPAVWKAYSSLFLITNRRIVDGEATDDVDDSLHYFYFDGDQLTARATTLRGWTETSEGNFWQAVAMVAGKLPGQAVHAQQLCLFVPGNRKTNAQAIEEYRVLHDMCFDVRQASGLGLCIAFDWASMSRSLPVLGNVKRAYRSNIGERRRAAGKMLAQVLERARSAIPKPAPQLRLSVVSQSLGMRVVLQGLLDMKTRSTDFIDHYYANAPDVADDFFHPAYGDADSARVLLDACRSITVAFSPRDTDLEWAESAMSQFGHRLGLRGPVPGSKHPNVFFQDVTRVAFPPDVHSGLFMSPWPSRFDRGPLMQRFVQDMLEPPARRYFTPD